MSVHGMWFVENHFRLDVGIVYGFVHVHNHEPMHLCTHGKTRKRQVIPHDARKYVRYEFGAAQWLLKTTRLFREKEEERAKTKCPYHDGECIIHAKCTITGWRVHAQNVLYDTVYDR